MTDASGDPAAGGRAHTTFDELFRSPQARRDKFLSRLFGLFSEEVVRHWCAVPEAPYDDLGRPTIWDESGTPRYHTLDFTLRDRSTGRTFASEMKCELEFEGYRYLRLVEPGQVVHHKSAAFVKFLRLARDPGALEVRIGGRPTQVDGAVLVWGALTSEGREAVMAEYGLADVLSVEDMVRDLNRWRPAEWQERVADLRGWSGELFDALAHPD